MSGSILSSSSSEDKNGSTLHIDGFLEFNQVDENLDSSNSSYDLQPPEPKKARKDDSNDVKETLDFSIKSTHKWVVENFDKDYQESKKGRYFRSPIFKVGSNNELEFELILYPKGITDEKNKTLPLLYFNLISKEELEFCAYYKCDWKRYNDNQSSENGVKHFGELKDLSTSLDTMQAIMMGNHFLQVIPKTFECEINVILNKKSMNMKKRVSDDFALLLETGNCSDSILETIYKQFKVHKSILVARCPDLAAKIKDFNNHNTRGRKTNFDKLLDIQSDVMADLLRYIYTGEIKNCNVSNKNLLIAADKYNLDDLKTICERALFKSLRYKSIIDDWKFAKKYNCNILKKRIIDYCVCHIKKITNDKNILKAMADADSLFLTQVIEKMVPKLK